MAESLILETTFLIDLERELAREKRGPAQAFLQENPASRLCITFTIAGEIAAGLSPSQRGIWERFLAPFHILPCTAEVSWRYGLLYRYLSDQGMLIGANDLWIAATAIGHSVPVVTRNARHFERAPGLEVRSYC